MSFPGMPGSGMGRSRDTEGMSDQEAAMVKAVQAATESCFGKSLISGVMGFALGGAFGLFMSSMSYDSSMTAQSQALQGLPVRQQIRAGLKDMGQRSFSSAKNFGTVGAVFAGTECVIEGFRAKNDMKNGIAAGCLTGGFLARSGGPAAVGVGCAGFAAFSAAIDYYMRMPSD